MINENANRKEFLDILDKKILVSDGSMGATLMTSGFSVLPDSLNLDSSHIKKIIDMKQMAEWQKNGGSNLLKHKIVHGSLLSVHLGEKLREAQNPAPKPLKRHQQE